jgi:NTP pyrophosphatase (non-canonical NTP hydrolase)
MEIKDLVKESHQTAVDHGWWDEDRNFGEQIALMHSELSEALEEYRNNKGMAETYYECKLPVYCPSDNRGICCTNGKKLNGKAEWANCPYAKPCGIPTELADCIIRIADTCGRYGIDLEKALKIKMEYNKLRPYKHGGKRA